MGSARRLFVDHRLVYLIPIYVDIHTHITVCVTIQLLHKMTFIKGPVKVNATRVVYLLCHRARWQSEELGFLQCMKYPNYRRK